MALPAPTQLCAAQESLSPCPTMAASRPRPPGVHVCNPVMQCVTSDYRSSASVRWGHGSPLYFLGPSTCPHPPLWDVTTSRRGRDSISGLHLWVERPGLCDAVLQLHRAGRHLRWADPGPSERSSDSPASALVPPPRGHSQPHPFTLGVCPTSALGAPQPTPHGHATEPMTGTAPLSRTATTTSDPFAMRSISAVGTAVTSPPPPAWIRGAIEAPAPVSVPKMGHSRVI